MGTELPDLVMLEGWCFGSERALRNLGACCCRAMAGVALENERGRCRNAAQGVFFGASQWRQFFY